MKKDKMKIWLIASITLVIISAALLYSSVYLPQKEQKAAATEFADLLLEYELPTAYDNTSSLMKANAEKITFIQYLQNFALFKGPNHISSYTFNKLINTYQEGIKIAILDSTFQMTDDSNWQLEITMDKVDGEWKVSGVVVTPLNEETS